MRWWTVILIPHDRGQRRSFNLSDIHIWGSLGTACVLAGLCLVLFFQSRSYRDEVTYLTERYQELEIAMDEQSLPVNMEERLAREERSIRTEYEVRDAAITTELSRLYDLEREVRIISGLPSRAEISQASGDNGGQGGFPGSPDAGIEYENADILPPELIYGLSNPSADLIIEEMRLRMQSLSALLNDAQALRLRLAHTPSIWPTNNTLRRLTSKFGMRKDPFTKEWRSHSGVDVKAAYGTPVLTTAEGVVTFSGFHQYLGHVVKIDHGYGLETWYGHLSKRLVQKGDTVMRGDVIGKCGSTGRSTGPHVHYEVHVNGKRVDPREYLGR